MFETVSWWKFGQHKTATKTTKISDIQRLLSLHIIFTPKTLILNVTPLRCQSEWPKDKPFLLVHSRHARNLYNSKRKRIFEIAWTLFEIIPFFHFYPIKKALARSQRPFIKNFYNTLPLQMNTFGPKIFDFHSWVKKCHISLWKIAKIALFNPCMKMKILGCQMFTFEVVNNSQL